MSLRARACAFCILLSVHSTITTHAGQLAIDKAAATRFIKNAISQIKDTTPTNVSGSAAAAATTTHTHIHLSDRDGDSKANDVRAPAKLTEKMLEREKYHEALREEALLSSEEDEGLEIVDNNGDDEGKANAVGSPISDVPPASSSTSAGKRRRPPVDPFAGS